MLQWCTIVKVKWQRQPDGAVTLGGEKIGCVLPEPADSGITFGASGLVIRARDPFIAARAET